MTRKAALALALASSLMLGGCANGNGHSRADNVIGGVMVGAMAGGAVGGLCCGDPVHGLPAGILIGGIVGGVGGLILPAGD